MSSVLYSLGSSSGVVFTSDPITLSSTAVDTFTIEDVIVAANGSAGTVTATLSIGGTQKGQPIVTSITEANTVYSIPFTGGGQFAGPLDVSASDAVSLTLTPSGGATLMAINASNTTLSQGFSTTPEVLTTGGLLISRYTRLNKENRRAGTWASSASPLWPVAAITRVRAEAPTPSFFTTVPNFANAWVFPTTFTSADLQGSAANGCFYYPPLQMPATLTASDEVVVEVRVGATSLSTTINLNNLWYTSSATAIQPRASLSINAAGTGATLITEAFQVYQDSEGMPLQSILSPNPSTGLTTIGTSVQTNFVMYMANGSTNSWFYDGYYGNAVQHNPAPTGGNLLRLYDNTELGRWGWNFGPANIYAQTTSATEFLVSGEKNEGGLGWPASTTTIINKTSFISTAGSSTSVMAIGAPLSDSHKSFYCIAWGTGILGTGYDPNTTVVPYAPRAANTVAAFNSAGTGWTATDATISEPMFIQGNYNTTTTGNAVLLIPHYIDRVDVYSAISDSDANYVKWTPSEVLLGTASITNSVINVVPVNYPPGDVDDSAEGLLWASRIRTLISDPNVQTVASSSLHAVECALSMAKNVVVMKFGDKVLGAGGKFKDFIETYTAQTTFSYTEPNTYVISPADLDGLTIANFNSHQSFTALYPSGDAVRGLYGTPYQGFPGYARYLLSTT